MRTYIAPANEKGEVWEYRNGRKHRKIPRARDFYDWKKAHVDTLDIQVDTRYHLHVGSGVNYIEE